MKSIQFFHLFGLMFAKDSTLSIVIGLAIALFLIGCIFLIVSAPFAHLRTLSKARKFSNLYHENEKLFGENLSGSDLKKAIQQARTAMLDWQRVGNNYDAPIEGVGFAIYYGLAVWIGRILMGISKPQGAMYIEETVALYAKELARLESQNASKIEPQQHPSEKRGTPEFVKPKEKYVPPTQPDWD